MKNVSIFLLSILLFVVPCFADQGNQQVAEQNNSLESVEWEDLTRKMELLYLKGDIKGAIKIGNKCKKMVEESGDVDSRSYAKLLQVLGNYNVGIGAIKKGENKLKKAFDIAKKINTSPADLADIQSDIGYACLMMGKYLEAEKWVKSATDNVNVIDTAKWDRFSNYLESIALLEQNYYRNYDKALRVFNKALKYSQSSFGSGKETRKNIILCSIAFLQTVTGDHEGAIGTLNKVLYFYKDKNITYHPVIAEAHYILGRAFTNISKYDDAKEHYIKALNISTKTMAESNSLIGNIYCGIAIIYAVNNDSINAQDYFRKAFNSNIDNFGQGTPVNTAITNNLSFLYFQNKEYRKALKENDLALSLCKKNNYKPDAIFLDILDTRVQILRRMGKKEEALKYENLIKKQPNENYN